MKTIIIVCLYILGAIVYGLMNVTDKERMTKCHEINNENNVPSSIQNGLMFVIVLMVASIWPIGFMYDAWINIKNR